LPDLQVPAFSTMKKNFPVKEKKFPARETQKTDRNM
jgi:hypothetical protein